jgi:ATP synthase protein I
MSQTPDDLEQRIKAAQERQRPPAPPEQDDTPGGGAAAMRVATDLVAALAVGGFMGYWLDEWLGTRPWLMVVFLCLGFAAGFLNIYRAQTGQDYKIGFTQLKPKNDETDNANKE